MALPSFCSQLEPIPKEKTENKITLTSDCQFKKPVNGALSNSGELTPHQDESSPKSHSFEEIRNRGTNMTRDIAEV